ncbi:cytochrome P450 [Ketobacter sp. MCCC 1A13808]|mgnify:CR=1 FL=1|uniref:cytochrome P450 n=1 Tax=Ketobacter sp. MCCC 1A13808 TaxID=2602738 RepID=UPI000F124432|nr:cytochrome P450 [Ketobacter sp. MCCC 1A13808]MVF13415.1 cytochrome P450 [Ketobacter sp. MCCC 1A13808]RLP55804.1 MAG: cytochrome P450 [Ketobacter sp.]
MIFDFIQSQNAGRHLKATLPGEPGLPLLGHSLDFLYRPVKTALRFERKHGPVFWLNIFGMTAVVLIGPEANKQVLLDREKAFSNSRGWDFFIGAFFKRGIMLLDFDEHRFHRGIMQAAFKKQALLKYVERMNPVIEYSLQQWPDTPVNKGQQTAFRVLPNIKQLTLNIATEVFMGEQLGPEADKVNQAFVNCVLGGTALIRYSIPGGRWRRGLKARKTLESFFGCRVAERRRRPGPDLFSQLCQAVDDNGKRFSEEDVVNHMIFLMMAAHDTSTITLCALFYYLAKHPHWQQALRIESENLAKSAVEYEDLDKLTGIEMVMKEALRMMPPVHGIPRRTVKTVEVNGSIIPADTFVIISPYVTHYLEQYWPDPERFDPERFSDPKRKTQQQPYQYIPFGGGAHKCIGLHFAELQVKTILHPILLNYRWQIPDDYVLPINFTTLPNPADGLPVKLSRLNRGSLT